MTLFGTLVTIVFWEAQIAMLFLQCFSPKKPGEIATAVFAVFTISLTCFVYTKGKTDFNEFRANGRNTQLTGFQCLLVVATMVATGSGFLWFADLAFSD